MNSLEKQFVDDIVNLIIELFEDEKELDLSNDAEFLLDCVKFNNNFLFASKLPDNNILFRKDNFVIRKLYANLDIRTFLVPQHLLSFDPKSSGFIYEIRETDTKNTFNIIPYSIIPLYFNYKKFYEHIYFTVLDYIQDFITGKKQLASYDDNYLLITNNLADTHIYLQIYYDPTFIKKYKDLLINGITYNNFIITLEGTAEKPLVKLTLNYHLTYSLLYYLIMEKKIVFFKE